MRYLDNKGMTKIVFPRGWMVSGGHNNGMILIYSVTTMHVGSRLAYCYSGPKLTAVVAWELLDEQLPVPRGTQIIWG